MKKFIFFLVVCAFAAQVNGTSYSKIEPFLSANEMFIPLGKTGQMISVQELSVIKVKDFEELTGRRMTFKEKIVFKGAQKELRNNIHRDGTLDKNFVKKLALQIKYHGKEARLFGVPFNLGGFLLGLFLALIGVLIAYLLKSENKNSMVRWAWIGCIISLIVWGAILI